MGLNNNNFGFGGPPQTQNQDPNQFNRAPSMGWQGNQGYNGAPGAMQYGQYGGMPQNYGMQQQQGPYSNFTTAPNYSRVPMASSYQTNMNNMGSIQGQGQEQGGNPFTGMQSQFGGPSSNVGQPSSNQPNSFDFSDMGNSLSQPKTNYPQNQTAKPQQSNQSQQSSKLIDI